MSQNHDRVVLSGSPVLRSLDPRTRTAVSLLQFFLGENRCKWFFSSVFLLQLVVDSAPDCVPSERSGETYRPTSGFLRWAIDNLGCYCCRGVPRHRGDAPHQLQRVEDFNDDATRTNNRMYGLAPRRGWLAQASMELTSGAQTDGFQLSTFASDFPSFLAGEGQNGGPFGIAFAGNGTVLVTDLNGHIYVFPSDANNQTVSGATVGATYNSYDPLGMTQTGGKIYVGFQTSSVIDQVSSTGTFVSTLASIPQPHGIVVNPTNGDLLVSSDSGSFSGGGISEVNPVSGAVTHIYSGVSFDGLTTDGVVVYAAREDGEVVGIRISDGAQVFDAGNFAGVTGSPWERERLPATFTSTRTMVNLSK